MQLVVPDNVTIGRNRLRQLLKARAEPILILTELKIYDILASQYCHCHSNLICEHIKLSTHPTKLIPSRLGCIDYIVSVHIANLGQ